MNKRSKIQKNKIVIIGNPVKHSLSPQMQNAAFKALKLPFHYSKIELPRKKLSSFFKNLRKNRFVGLNITIPYKEESLKYINQLSPEAKLIGSINTILVTPKKIKGFNTDGEGYFQSLREETHFSPQGKNIILLGAGGAARSILVSLCKRKIKKLTLINRTEIKAKNLAQEFKEKFPRTKFDYDSLKSDRLKDLFKETDILINTTSIGLKGTSFSNLPLSSLPQNAIVSDIVYRPRLTPLLKEAKKHHLKIHEGVGMLLHQGVLSFKIWTKRKAPIRVMKRALEKSLKN